MQNNTRRKILLLMPAVRIGQLPAPWEEDLTSTDKSKSMYKIDFYGRDLCEGSDYIHGRNRIVIRTPLDVNNVDIQDSAMEVRVMLTNKLFTRKTLVYDYLTINKRPQFCGATHDLPVLNWGSFTITSQDEECLNNVEIVNNAYWHKIVYGFDYEQGLYHVGILSITDSNNELIASYEGDVMLEHRC